VVEAAYGDRLRAVVVRLATGGSYFTDWFNGWGDPRTDYDAKILGPANRAIRLTPDDPSVYYAKAVYLALSGRHSEALGVADAGLAINPNFVLLYIPRAAAENSLGRYDEAQADVEQAMRLSPHDILIPVFHVFVGEAEIGLGHFDAAIDEFFTRRSTRAMGRSLPTRTCRPPTRKRVGWTRRRRPSPTIPRSRSNG
jgi:tetratricopeptide (TPR) repeat protein